MENMAQELEAEFGKEHAPTHPLDVDWERHKHWVTPANILPYFPDKIETDRYLIEKFTFTEERVKKEKIKSLLSLNYGETYDLKPGTYIRMVRKPKTGHTSWGEIVMSTTPMEIRTNMDYLTQANGHVLQAGLGLGLTAITLMTKPNVKSITVIEIDREVIELIAPRLPFNNKVKIIEADIFDWPLPKGVLWDTIYFDIWDTVTEDNWEGMKRLRRKFAKRLNRANPKAWVACWRSHDCKPERSTRWWT